MEHINQTPETLGVPKPQEDNGAARVDVDARTVSDEAPDEDSSAERADTRQARRLRELRERIEAQHLPVAERMGELEQSIREAMEGSGILILQGETGSGKSVYTPLALRKILHERGFPDRIFDMQPRRDATYLIAEAGAAVMGEELGKGVGYSTSEVKAVESDSAVQVMTSGILLRRLKEGLVDANSVGAIILDEVHENSIEYHLVLGLVKRLREQGKAPFVLLTSATPDTDTIRGYYGIGEENFLKIEGRSHPVDHRFIDVGKMTEEVPGEDRVRKRSYIELAVDNAQEYLETTDQGDILVFLPGWREIEDFVARFKENENVEALPLHGMLSKEDRERALVPPEERTSGKRRIIAATNIAETSVTVPGITHVIDSCRQKVLRFDVRSGIRRSQVEFISKAQAKQRAGRAGRIESGSCLHLVTEREYEEMPEQSEAEIHRSNLSHVVLTCKSLNIDPEVFPFIDPPDQAKIHSGIEELKLLGMLDTRGDLTDIGREAMKLPFEPHASRMILEARRYGCVIPALLLAALERESKGIFLGPTKRDIDEADGWGDQQKKINARKQIAKIITTEFLRDRDGWERSDLLLMISAFLKALDHGVLETMRRDESPEGRRAQRAFKEWCRARYVRPESLTHVAYRLMDFAELAGEKLDYRRFKEHFSEESMRGLNRAIISGYINRLHILQTMGRGMPQYVRYGDRQENEVNMSPGSLLFSTPVRYCISLETKPGGQEYVQRNYASGNHEVTLPDIYAVYPDVAKPFEVQFLEEQWEKSRLGWEHHEVVALEGPGSNPVLVGGESALPKVYGEDLGGSDLIAYPVIKEYPYKGGYYVIYTKSEAEARRENERVKSALGWQEEAQEREGRKNAVDLYARLGGVLLSLRSNARVMETYGLEDRDLDWIQGLYDEAKRLFEQDLDYRGMTAILSEVKNFLEEKRWQAEMRRTERETTEASKEIARRAEEVEARRPLEMRTIYDDWTGGSISTEVGPEIENPLGAALRQAQGRQGIDGAAVAPPVSAESPKPAPARSPEQSPDWVLPDEERETLMLEARDEYELLAAVLKALPKRAERTGSTTKEEALLAKATDTLQKKRKEVLGNVSQAADTLAGYAKMTRRTADQLAGKRGEMRRAVESLLKSKDLITVLSSGYNPGWYDSFVSAYHSIREYAVKNEMVRELLPEDKTQKELISRAQGKMLASVSEAIHGKTPNVERIVEETLNEMVA